MPTKYDLDALAAKFSLPHAFTHLGIFLLTLGVVGLLVLQTPAPVAAQAKQLAVESLLNTDGTLNLTTGASGAVDLRGWHVTLDPQRGPVLSRGNAGEVADETGSALGHGLYSAVNALAVSGTDVYVGGVFSAFCGNDACDIGSNTTVNNVARWDGNQWQAMGHGFNGSVDALAVSGSDLYAAGDFTVACGDEGCGTDNIPAKFIARWDGSQWHAVGHGVDNTVYTLAVSGSDVYVAGRFTEICGNDNCDTGNTTVNHIARWDGSQWHELGHGISSFVYALAVSGSNVYASGDFTAVCGNDACNSGNTTVNNIARWDGSQWHALGHGINGSVDALAVNGSGVYGGGDFSVVCGNDACNSGNTTVNNIARWDGSQWQPLGAGLNNIVFGIGVSGNDVYAGGFITQVCGNVACNSGNTSVNHMARWDGTAWHSVAHGVPAVADAFVVSRGIVYVGGVFSQVCGNDACNSDNLTVNNIAQFTLTPTQTGPSFTVNTNADTDDGVCDTLGQGHGNKDCTLREAMNAANAQSGADTITFAGDTSVSLNASLPTIAEDLTIDAGTHTVGLNGNSTYRILHIAAGVVNLKHLSFQFGVTDTALDHGKSGGAIHNEGTLSVSDSLFVHNGADDYAGAIFTNGTLNIENSTFINNTGGCCAGAVYAVAPLTVNNSSFKSSSADYGGAISSSTVITVSNSTFAGNVANVEGGGILADDTLNLSNSTFGANSAGEGGAVWGKTLSILNSTFSGNSAGAGAAVRVNSGGALTLRNSILANSTGPDCTNNGTVASEKNNLIESTGANACGRVNGVHGDIVGVDPKLGTPGSHGGATQTFPLLVGSPAFDTGDDATCSAAPVSGKDQRGTIRPQMNHCDMGSFELALSDCTEKPAQATLLKPKNKKTIGQSKVKFDWSDAMCGVSYKVTVQNTKTGAKVKKTFVLSKGKIQLAAGTYKWFVQACDTQGCTKSRTFTFTN